MESSAPSPVATPVAGIRERLQAVPPRPGVYLMKDDTGRILYVGKASRLRARLRSYFGCNSALSPKVRTLLSRVTDFEYIVTDSEKEALLLESNFIKEHRPRFNVVLRDDKQYLYLRIDLREAYPRIALVRQPGHDAARYFGPFTDAQGLRRTIAHLQRLFQFRTCTLDMSRAWPRPCLLYHIKRCLGPCIRATTEAEYADAAQSLIAFLEGRRDVVLGQLRQQMEEAAEALAFERAAAIRDRLRAAEKMAEQQKVTSLGRGDVDVIAGAVDGADATVLVFTIRNDKVVGRENFALQHADDIPLPEILSQFIQQYYGRATFVPERILLQANVQARAPLAQWLSDCRGAPVRLEVPRRGERRQLVALAEQNAREALEQAKLKWLADERKTRGAVLEVQRYLGLPHPPHRIECYDISNIQGTSPVASMVVFEDGQPRRDAYRRFHIKSVQHADDFAMMAEVIRRRFRRAAPMGVGSADLEARDERHAGEQERGGEQGPPECGDPTGLHSDVMDAMKAIDQVNLPAVDEADVEDPWLAGDLATQEPLLPASSSQPPEQGWRALPDLVIVDGGKGQLSAALGALAETGVDGIPMVGLAKQREEIFRPGVGEPLLLPRTSQALYLMQRVRDEAHRFAVSFHRQVRTKRAFRSRLDEVPSVGPKRKKALLAHFGSIRRIQQASVDELAAVGGMTRRAALEIKQHL